MGLVTTPVVLLVKLAVLCIRVTWLLTFGWAFAALYLIAGLVLSPFGMLYGRSGERAMETAIRIAWLKPATNG